MSRTVVSLRLSVQELQFVDRLAAEKGVTRSAALHQLFLQQVALREIEKAVAGLVDSRLAGLAAMRAELSEMRQEIGASVKRDDLIKATNFLVKELKK